MRRCSKGKPCGATCIEKSKECLADTQGGVSKSLGKARSTIQGQSATYKIAKSADPSSRPTQLHARRILNALKNEANLIKTDGLVKEGSINWRSVLGSDVKSVGSGDFGSFATLPSSKLLSDPKDLAKVPAEVGVKVGKIGPSEVRAIKITGDNDLGPRLIGAKVSPDVKPGKGKIEGSNGAVAMTKVPGIAYRNSPDSINGFPKSEMYWEAMASLHKLGIAHNDMHSGNVLIDASGKPPRARFVDFGLAQVSSKAALAEALGVMSGENWQFSASKAKGHALTFKANLPYIEQLLIEKGFSNYQISAIMKGGFRKKDKFFNQGAWGKLSEEDAKSLVEGLYMGIVDD